MSFVHSRKILQLINDALKTFKREKKKLLKTNETIVILLGDRNYGLNG